MKKKLVDTLESLCRLAQEDKHESEIQFTQEQIVCTSTTMGSTGWLILVALTIIPSIYLWQFAGTVLSKCLAVIWLLIFLKLIMDFLKSELKLTTIILPKTFQIERISLPVRRIMELKVIISKPPTKLLEFSEIKELILRQTNRYQYVKEETQILAVTNDDRKVLLAEFRNKFLAKMFIFVLREILKA